MQVTGKIDYVELSCGSIEPMKRFYQDAFGWSYEDYGPSYAAWKEAGLDGGFQAGAPAGTPPLVILYADDLEVMVDKVVAAGGQISMPIFAFPGGRRFQFRDPAGNELGVWSKR